MFKEILFPISCLINILPHSPINDITLGRITPNHVQGMFYSLILKITRYRFVE